MQHQICGAVATVTQYPYKPAKTKQREESVVVCVVERRPREAGSSSSFLLVQRPPSGLLASLWDFPSVNLGPKREVSHTEAQQSINTFLCDLLGHEHPISLSISGIETDASGEEEMTNNHGKFTVERTYAGETTFLFSHIKHFYEVEWLCFTPESASKDLCPPSHSTIMSRADAKRKRGREEAGDDDADGDGLNQTRPAIRWLDEADLQEAAIPKGMKNCFDLVATLRKTKPQKRQQISLERRRKQKRIDSFFANNKKS